MLTLARDLAGALDPALFALSADIELDPWQRDLVRAVVSGAAKRVLLLASRQVGKSYTVGLLALHVAVHEPGSLIIILSPSMRQSGEMLRSIKLMHQRIDGAVPFKSESVLKLELENNSRLLALPGGDADGKTIRGLAGARLILLDEASRIPDDLMGAVRPTMATNPNAALVALTTPAGRRGFFHDAWHSSDPTWLRIRVNASDCPRITHAFLDEERRALGDLAFRSEYMLEFLDDQTSVFSTDLIDCLFNKDLRALWT